MTFDNIPYPLISSYDDLSNFNTATIKNLIITMHSSSPLAKTRKLNNSTNTNNSNQSATLPTLFRKIKKKSKK